MLSRLIARLRVHKHLALVVVLLATLFVQPAVATSGRGLLFFEMLFGLLVVCVFLVVLERTSHRLLSLVVAISAVATRWGSHAFTGDSQFAATVAHHALVAIYLCFAVGVILRGIFQERAITSDHVLGSVCGYLLAGAVWGNVYVLAELIVPGSFDVKPQIAPQLDQEDTRMILFNYFSFCTLTGAGYGDITPIRPAIASLTWLEAMFGQFYIAVVVAQLVGLKLAHAITHPPAKPD